MDDAEQKDREQKILEFTARVLKTASVQLQQKGWSVDKPTRTWKSSSLTSEETGRGIFEFSCEVWEMDVDEIASRVVRRATGDR